MSELADWLALWRVPGVGPATFQALTRRFGSPGGTLQAAASQLRHLGLSAETIAGIRHPNRGGVARDLAWAAQENHCIVRICEPFYPSRLREIPDPPPVLFVSGDPRALADPQIAVVGSRHPTPVGRANARAFGAQLAQAGLTVTSGLAAGIDSAAHEGALAAGGLSIAVFATGPERVYPARNRELAQRIASQGACVSEFPTGVAPQPQHFPRRNRLISGLSLGVLVVEAARRSGSLITAGFAADQGREVFAIPGSIRNSTARGCHHLIRHGAKLVESVQDVLEEVRHQLDTKTQAQQPVLERAEVKLDETSRRLLDNLGFDPSSVDELVERSGLTVDTVSSMLLMLELKGLIAAVAGGQFVRLPVGSTQ